MSLDDVVRSRRRRTASQEQMVHARDENGKTPRAAVAARRSTLARLDVRTYGCPEDGTVRIHDAEESRSSGKRGGPGSGGCAPSGTMRTTATKSPRSQNEPTSISVSSFVRWETWRTSKNVTEERRPWTETFEYACGERHGNRRSTPTRSSRCAEPKISRLKCGSIYVRLRKIRCTGTRIPGGSNGSWDFHVDGSDRFGTKNKILCTV